MTRWPSKAPREVWFSPAEERFRDQPLNVCCIQIDSIISAGDLPNGHDPRGSRVGTFVAATVLDRESDGRCHSIVLAPPGQNSVIL